MGKEKAKFISEPEREIAKAVLEKFEDMLESKNISIPSDDREGVEGEARLYGSEYYQLEDEVAGIIGSQAMLKNQEIILEALNDYRRWFYEDDMEKTREIDQAIREVGGMPSVGPAFCPAVLLNGSVKRLPIVKLIDGKTYFIDARLNQLRNVDNPHDYLDF